MFRLRDVHMDAFASAHLQECVRRIRRGLGLLLWEELAGTRPEQLDELIRSGIAVAEAHGLWTEPDLLRFCELLVVLGPEFHQLPPFRVILADAVVGPEKARRLLDAAIIVEHGQQLAGAGVLREKTVEATGERYRYLDQGRAAEALAAVRLEYQGFLHPLDGATLHPGREEAHMVEAYVRQLCRMPEAEDGRP